MVKGYALLIKERSEEKTHPTSTSDITSPIYTYRLYVDKDTIKDHAFLVIAGEWIGNSYKDHPDTVKVPNTNGTLGSHNHDFNKNIDIYRKYFVN